MGLLEIGIGIVLIILAGLFLIVYNTLISLKNNYTKAWANIDVLLQQRHDMIPKLVDVVKGYRDYEQAILIKLTKLRTSWMEIKPDDLAQKAQTSDQISQALKTVFATSENYPDLKASQSFLDLQNTLVSIETQIAERREFYNDSVNEYNIKIAQVPYTLFSGMLGYKPAPFFTASDDAKQDTVVDTS